VHRTARIQARIKQLCCLGLGGEAIMPALFQELHALIPSYGNQFMWADEQHRLSNLYGEVPEVTAIGPLYLQEFYNSRETEVVCSFSDFVRNVYGVKTRDESLVVDKDSFYRSTTYNEVFRPLGYDDFVRLTVREHGKAPGQIALFRRPKEPSFTAAEVRLLADLEPFIAHALTRQQDTDATLVDSGESGLIVADATGKPVYLSNQGRRLLFLATNPEVAPGRVAPLTNTLPAALQRVCRNLAAVVTGDENAEPPVHRHANAWGGFTFRAYRMNEADGSAILIGITVAREEPLPVRLVRSTEHLPLSHRQAEVCVLMASGLTYRQIADRLGISAHTAIAHTRAVYDALGVSNRTELLNCLLANGQGAVGANGRGA
jgi:DNA-binding CsgD family transcriptional regulator